MMLAILAGLLTGFFLGLTGAGGSILTLPALILLVGLAPHDAVAATLVSVLLTALTGIVPHVTAGHVRLRAGAALLAGSAPAALVGGYLGRDLPEPLLMTAFGCLMVWVAWRMWRKDHDAPRPRASTRRLVLLGAGVGLLSGTLGLGGGFLIVPALAGPGGLAMQEVAGTAMALVAANAGAGLVGALARLPDVPWHLVLPFVAASLVGGQVGSRMTARLPARQIARVFAVVVVVVGAEVLWTWIPRLLPLA